MRCEFLCGRSKNIERSQKLALLATGTGLLALSSPRRSSAEQRAPPAVLTGERPRGDPRCLQGQVAAETLVPHSLLQLVVHLRPSNSLSPLHLYE